MVYVLIDTIWGRVGKLQVLMIAKKRGSGGGC